MDYKKNYDDYLNYIKLSNRQLDGYTEIHHIIPKCLGGTDSKENLIELTAREHFLAHYLLTKIYPSNYKLLDAFRMMGVCNENEGQKRYMNSRLYQSKKEGFCKARGKPVICVETGEVFYSISKAEREVCYGIKDVVHGRQLTAGGYHWKLLNEETKIKQPFQRKKVVCLETKQIFNSTKEAADFFGVNESLIKSVCNGTKGHHTARGFKFAYKED